MLFGPVGIIALIATTLGIIYYKNHTDMHSSGFKQDYQKVINELDDILSADETLGVGYTYRPIFLEMVKKFKTDLATLYDFYMTNMLPYLDKLQIIDPNSENGASQLIEVAQSSIPKDLTTILNQYKTLAKTVNAKIARAIVLFEQPGFRQQQIEHEGKLSEVAEAIPGLYGGHGLISNDFGDIVNALNTFQEDIIESINGIDKANETAQSSQQALEATNQSFDKATSPSTESSDEFSPEEAYEKWMKNKI